MTLDETVLYGRDRLWRKDQKENLSWPYFPWLDNKSFMNVILAVCLPVYHWSPLVYCRWVYPHTVRKQFLQVSGRALFLRGACKMKDGMNHTHPAIAGLRTATQRCTYHLSTALPILISFSSWPCLLLASIDKYRPRASSLRDQTLWSWGLLQLQITLPILFRQRAPSWVTRNPHGVLSPCIRAWARAEVVTFTHCLVHTKK